MSDQSVKEQARDLAAYLRGRNGFDDHFDIGRISISSKAARAIVEILEHVGERSGGKPGRL